MPEWRARVEGTKIDLLAGLGEAGVWSIVTEGQEYYLTSPVFAALDDFSAVRAAVNDLLERINQAAFLHLQTRHRLTVHSFERIDKDGTKHRFFEATGTAAGEASAGAVGGVIDAEGRTVAPPPSASPVALTSKLLSQNPEVAAAVRLFVTKYDDWTQLCNVIAMVRNAIHGEIPEAWAPSKSIELLEWTAQGQSTAGNTARHVIPPGKIPPPRPMELAEAQEIIRRILVQWTRSQV
jgi:hypothetical protein